MTKILFYRPKKIFSNQIELRLKAQRLEVSSTCVLDEALEIISTERLDLVILKELENQSEIIEILETIKTEKNSALTLVITHSTSQTTSRFLAAGASSQISDQTSWLEFWLGLKNLLELERKVLRPVEDIMIGNHYFEEGILVQAGQQIKLRQKENRILECLTKYQHRVLSRNDLMKYVWSCPADYPSPDTIDVYIRRLRLKLGMNGDAIKTYRGFGYRWEPAT